MIQEQSSAQQKTIENISHGLAGGLAAMLSSTFLHPLETIPFLSIIRSVIVTSEEEQINTSQIIEERVEKPKKKFQLMKLIKKILKEEGLDKQMLGSLIAFTVYFFWYKYCQQRFVKFKGDNLGNLKSSLCAGVITSITTNPYWVVFTRYQLSKKSNKSQKISVMNIITDIIQEEGISGFLKGSQAALLLVSNPVIQFIGYDFFKRKFSGINNSTLRYFCAGAVSKLIATIFTYPILTVKTCLQAKKKDLTLGICLQQIYKNEGVSGFYKGISAKLLQTVLNAALMLTFYEKIQKFMIVVLKMRVKN